MLPFSPSLYEQRGIGSNLDLGVLRQVLYDCATAVGCKIFLFFTFLDSYFFTIFSLLVQAKGEDTNLSLWGDEVSAAPLCYCCWLQNKFIFTFLDSYFLAFSPSLCKQKWIDSNP
jgi:hypothetical protein